MLCGYIIIYELKQETGTIPAFPHLSFLTRTNKNCIVLSCPYKQPSHVNRLYVWIASFLKTGTSPEWALADPQQYTVTDSFLHYACNSVFAKTLVHKRRAKCTLWRRDLCSGHHSDADICIHACQCHRWGSFSSLHLEHNCQMSRRGKNWSMAFVPLAL